MYQRVCEIHILTAGVSQPKMRNLCSGFLLIRYKKFKSKRFAACKCEFNGREQVKLAPCAFKRGFTYG